MFGLLCTILSLYLNPDFWGYGNKAFLLQTAVRGPNRSDGNLKKPACFLDSGQAVLVPVDAKLYLRF